MTNNKKAFIFIGRSGCGKGTQAKLLMDYLKEKGVINDQTPLFYVETGDKFRQFVAGTSHSSRLAREVMTSAARQPDFLAVWMWSHLLVENLMGDELLVCDGTPRSLIEAQIMDTAFDFYGYLDVYIINIDVGRDWARERLLSRGRADDKKESEVEARLDWYDRDVLPAVEYYSQHPKHTFVKVNGEQTVEEVFTGVIDGLDLETQMDMSEE